MTLLLLYAPFMLLVTYVLSPILNFLCGVRLGGRVEGARVLDRVQDGDLAAAAIGAAVLGGIIAGVKNRDYSFWIAWCLILPPMLIFLAMLPRRSGERPRRPSLDDQERHW